MTASSSGLWLVNRVPGSGPRDPCGGSSRSTGAPGAPSATGGGASRGPLGPLILGGQKSAHFCPPAVQSREGVGGLRPLT